MKSSTMIPEVLESERINALRSYEIDYSLSEESIDRISRLASIICNKPIALVTFIDEHRQWIKSSIGIKLKYTEREVAFCNHTIRADGIFEVTDTLEDFRFKENPSVTGEPKIRFYAGVPLITSDGFRVGSVCVIDRKPSSLTEEQKEALTLLSDSVVRVLELKKQKRQLAEERKRADQAVRAKADFLSTMSHEIRTPLNGISGIAHLLMEEDHLPDQVNYLKTLKFSAGNLMSIVNDILDFSKIEAGAISFEEINFNLNELLSEIKNANQIKAKDKQIVVKLKRDDDLPEVVIGDPFRLSQILNNLVNNAIKFTHVGEVMIDVHQEKYEGGRYKILFSVKDSGIGIPSNKLHQLFDPFTQMDSSITRKFGGTGLGLTITKRLLELQGSTLNVSSELNQGSEFSFRLNFHVPSGAYKKSDSAYIFQSLQGASILLAEDNEVNVLIAQRIMRSWDITLEHANNGKEVLEKLTHQKFNLVLMDLQMPVMDGYEAARYIRNEGYPHANLPIIALTASATADEKNAALEAGMDDFLSKPFDPVELHRKMQKHLQLAMENGGKVWPLL